MEYLLIIPILLIGALWLLVQRWFWFIALGLSSLASVFSCIASIFHFEILAAVGYFVLAFILLAITSAVADT